MNDTCGGKRDFYNESNIIFFLGKEIKRKKKIINKIRIIAHWAKALGIKFKGGEIIK